MAEVSAEIREQKVDIVGYNRDRVGRGDGNDSRYGGVLCKWFQFGHWKFRDQCRIKHVRVLCEVGNQQQELWVETSQSL